MVLTDGTHAGISATDRTTTRGTVATRRVRRQTRVVPIAVSALVPGRTLTPIVGAGVHAATRSAVLTGRRRAGLPQLLLAVGTRASRRTYTAVPGTS